MISKQQISLFFLACSFLSSCVAHKDLISFRSGDEKVSGLPPQPAQNIANQLDMKLQSNDVLAILISSASAELSIPYNYSPGQLITQITTPTSPTTYLINIDGNIEIPSLGSFKAKGLTIKELRDSVYNRVSAFLLKPSVNIRILNFKVSVIGEVARPGTIEVENERITILEALARAGDLTPFSNREHITVIREIDGVRQVGDISLKSTEFFKSPFYYLQQNDVVYVEPNKTRVAQVQQPFNTYIQPVSVSISFIALLFAIFKK